MDNIDNNLNGNNTMFDIIPANKENDLLQSIHDKNKMDIDTDNQQKDISSDEIPLTDDTVSLSKKRIRTQMDDTSSDEIQSTEDSSNLTKKPKRIGGNITIKFKNKKLPFKKTKRKIQSKKRKSSTIKHNKLNYKHKRHTHKK